MKKIKLTQGKYAIIDDEDYERVSKYKWLAHKTRGDIWYVENHFGKTKYLHRFILKLKNCKKEVDHINRDPLDNRKENLRLVDRKSNLINRKKFKNKSSKFKGISVIKKGKKNKFSVYFCRDKKKKWLGSFNNEKLAKEAWDRENLVYCQNLTKVLSTVLLF